MTRPRRPTLLACLAVLAVGFATPTLVWHAWPGTWGDPLVSAALADVGLLAGLLVDLAWGEGGS